MVTNADVVVAGAGLAGATAALALAREGLRVVVVDAQPKAAVAFDGRASLISFGPFRLWRGLGLAERLPAAQAVTAMVVTDGSARSAAPGWSSSAWLGFDAGELEGRDAGEPIGFMVENAQAQEALRTALAEAGVVVIAPAVVNGIVATPTGAEVRLDNGQALMTALVVAADGRDSGLRRAAGIETSGWTYEQSAVVASIAHERPHDGVARQVFLPSGPLAVLPLSGNRSSLVWTESPARAAALASMAEEAFNALLLRRMGEALGAVKLEGPRWTHPLRVQVADRYTAERLVLVGDAACSVHPLAGQGLNLGLKDAAALAEIVGEVARIGEDPGSAAVLDRYARRRRFEAATLASATDALRRVYGFQNPLLRAVRTAGVAAVGRAKPLRRFFIREAGGVTGDPPSSLL